MSDLTDVRDSWLVLGDCTNGVTHLTPECEGTLDAGTARYLETNRDDVLLLELIGGCAFRILASGVRWWYVSTPAHRLSEWTRERWARDEEREAKMALGLPWSDD